MHNIFIKTCLGLSLLFIILFPSSIYAQTLYQETFENSLTGWTATVSSLTYGLNPTNAYEGQNAAEIRVSSSTVNGLKDSILPILPNTSYTIRGYIKASQGTKKAFIRIAWYQAGSSSQIRTDDSFLIPTTPDMWTHTEFTVVSPSNAASAEIRLLVSEGSAQFDSLLVTETTPNPVTETPTPTPTPMTTSSPTPTHFLPSPTASPTISEVTPSITPTPNLSNSILISEALVYPDVGASEWVELYNSNSYNVNLVDWYIDDADAGGSSPKKFTLVLSPYSYGSIDISTSMFNNDGDTIRILDSSGGEQDAIEYSSSQKGMSIGRDVLESDQICIQSITKNTTNNACYLEPTPTYTVAPTSPHSPTPTKTPSPTRTPTPTRTPSPTRITTPSKTIIPDPTIQSHAVYKKYTNDSLFPKSSTAKDARRDVLGVVHNETPHSAPVKKKKHVTKAFSTLSLTYSCGSILALAIKILTQ